MAELTRYRCDLAQCNVESESLAGWIAITVKQTYRTGQGYHTEPTITLKPINGKLPSVQWKHYCGVTHALQAVSEAIGGWSKLRPAQAQPIDLVEYFEQEQRIKDESSY